MAYGFKAHRADGSVLIDSTDGVARLVYSADVAEAFTGTVSVPAFDSDLGYYTARLYPWIQERDGTYLGPEPESTNWNGGKDNLVMIVSPAHPPTLAWDNATKVMTITANAETEELGWQVARYRYRLLMVHYK